MVVPENGGMRTAEWSGVQEAFPTTKSSFGDPIRRCCCHVTVGDVRAVAWNLHVAAFPYKVAQDCADTSAASLPNNKNVFSRTIGIKIGFSNGRASLEGVKNSQGCLSMVAAYC